MNLGYEPASESLHISVPPNQVLSCLRGKQMRKECFRSLCGHHICEAECGQPNILPPITPPTKLQFSTTHPPTLSPEPENRISKRGTLQLFEAHGLVHHSTRGSRVIKEKTRTWKQIPRAGNPAYLPRCPHTLPPNSQPPVPQPQTLNQKPESPNPEPSGDTAPCKVTPVILHGVVSAETWQLMPRAGNPTYSPLFRSTSSRK